MTCRGRAKKGWKSFSMFLFLWIFFRSLLTKDGAQTHFPNFKSLFIFNEKLWKMICLCFGFIYLKIENVTSSEILMIWPSHVSNMLREIFPNDFRASLVGTRGRKLEPEIPKIQKLPKPGWNKSSAVQIDSKIKFATLYQEDWMLCTYPY